MSKYLAESTPPDDHRTRQAQLMMSLKFHHAKTLSEMPLDVAIQALTQVWESCQPKKPSQDDDVICF